MTPAFYIFKPVTEDEVSKSINESPTKSCPLDPIPAFLLKDCLDILLPSITKLVNYSLIDGSFPSTFKRVVVTPALKRPLCPEMILRTITQCLVFVSCQSWLSKLLLSNLQGPRWQSGNTLASHLCGRGSIPVMAVSGKAGSCLPLVGSLQYRTLANYMYWFPLPFQLPVVI